MTKRIRYFNKMLFLLPCLMISSVLVNAQLDHTIHVGEWFKVNEGTQIYFQGNYTDSTVTGQSDYPSRPLTNLGDVVLRKNLINRGVNNVFGQVSQPKGWAMFQPFSDSVFVLGDTTVHFHNIKINLAGSGDKLFLNKYSIINDTLLMTRGDIYLTDSLTMLYVNGVSNTSVSGIVSETNTNRIYSNDANIAIRVENYPWNIPGSYSYGKLKGVGLTYTVNDNLGATIPVLKRFNIIQSCGPTQNSVNRTYKFTDIQSTTGQVSNVSAKFNNPSELGLNLTGDSMHIYKSHNNADSWEDILGTYGLGEVTNSPSIHTISNNSIYTIAKDTCDVLPDIQINQIITATMPFDTLFAIDTAMACDPLNPDATLMSQGPDGIYTWIYPDNSKHSGDQNGTITPVDLGAYYLIVQDVRGCINIDTVNVLQAPPAGASFSVPSAGQCVNTVVNFTPDSSQLSGYTYEWNFGDGTTSSAYAPTHTYTNDSTYTVSLTVTTDQGCIDGNTESLVIHPIPVASFTSDPACPGFPVQLYNNSSANPLQPVVLEWDVLNNGSVDTITNGMGDGSGGDAQYVFASEGTYNIKLVATSNGCQSSPVIGSVTVHPLPQPDFTYTNACEGQNVSFTNTSVITGGTAMTYEWNFNGSVGPTSTLQSPTYNYPSAATYTVTLEATSDKLCVASTSQQVTVDENPVANFNVTNVCVNNPAVFADLSTVGAPANIVSWDWTFGDGNTGTLQNGSNTYTADGNYNVSLTVTTGQNCVGTATKSITIYPGPTIGFSALDGCVGSSVAFQNTTTNATSYEWNFPVLSVTSTNTHENQIFNVDGTHAVHLTASSANGCSSTYTDSVTIHPLPQVDLGGAIATCSTSYVLDANLNNVNAGSTYFWSTGATTPQFDVTYNGNFSVTVTSPFGCVASDNSTVTLNSAVTPDLGPDRTVCDAVVLDAGYSGATYSWMPYGQFTQSINATSSGTYSVSVTDQNGCVGTGSVNITVTTSDPISLGATQQFACDGESIILNAFTNPSTTYQWNDASTNSSLTATTSGYYSVVLTNSAGCVSGDTVELVFESAPVVDLGMDGAFCEQKALNVFDNNVSYLWSTGSTQSDELITNSGVYWVDVTDVTTNCTTRDSIDIIINDLPVVDLGNDTTLCSYDNITLDAKNSGGSYVWNNGALTQTTTVYATGMYSVQVTDANGCVNSGQVNVTVNPLFEFDLGQDLPYCLGSVITLDPNAGVNASTYNWYSSNSSSLGTSATYDVPDTGKYYVEIVDVYGCVAIDSINILPSSLSLNAVYLSDSKVKTGDTIKFVNLSYPKPYDSHWDFGNGAFTTDSMPTYTYFIPGDYDVKLTVDNGNCVSTRTKTITVEPTKSFDIQPETMSDLLSGIIDVIVYPNPNDGNFSLRLKLKNESAVQLEMYNMIGQLVGKDSFVAKDIVRTYSMKHLKTGMYMIRVRNGKDTKTVKFVKI